MSENLFIFNGVLTATAGSAATAEPLPEANVDANGKVTVVQPGGTGNATSATDNTQTDAGTTAGDTTTSAGGSASGAQTGTTSEAGTETAGSAAVEGGNEATGTDAGMGGGEVGNMTGEAGMTGGGDAAMDGAGGMDGMGTETGTSSSITQSAPAMIGITAGVLALSILAGIVLAKLKIKKGINLYED